MQYGNTLVVDLAGVNIGRYSSDNIDKIRKYEDSRLGYWFPSRVNEKLMVFMAEIHYPIEITLITLILNSLYLKIQPQSKTKSSVLYNWHLT